MLPIHHLLSRIRWDREFGQGEFVLGYYDRILGQVVRVSLAEIIFPQDRGDAILVMDRDGVLQSIPLHRIKEVYRNGELIWHRTH